MNCIIVPHLRSIIDLKQFPNEIDILKCVPMKNLNQYLDVQLEIVAEYLYPSTFIIFLKELWETIMNVNKLFFQFFN